MISVKLNDQARDVMQHVKISPARVEKTFNERHRGLLIPGNPMRIGAIHWFKDDQTVFCIGSVSKSHKEGEQLYFQAAVGVGPQ